jgi:Fe2+ or Zn2+ uptake regulation protein
VSDQAFSAPLNYIVYANAIVLHLQLKYYKIETMSQVHAAIQVLRSNGYKVTEPRKRVLKALAEAESPVSPYDIQEILQRKGEYLNHVTIYRVLELLCSLNLAHKVLLVGGFVKCTLGEKSGCHRFVICRQCGALREYSDKALCEEENAIAQEFGFRTEQHFSEFSGICSECVASAGS